MRTSRVAVGTYGMAAPGRTIPALVPMSSGEGASSYSDSQPRASP